MLKRISAWYDTLQEPYRFVVFAFLVFGPGLPFGIAMATYSAGIAVLPTAFAALGFAHLAFVYALAIYRATRK